MAEELSKSAKRRAAKKARDAAAEEPAPAPAAPAPKSKAAASAPAGYPVPKAKAKADAKAAAPEPAPPAPKAKAKSKAAAPEPAPPPAPEPKGKSKAKAAQPAPAPEPAPKPAAKSKAGAKAKPEPKEEPKAEKTEIVQPFEMDDGTGDWEVSTGLTKKQQKQKDKKDEEARLAMLQKQAGSAGNKKIAGFNAEAGGPALNTIPGMGPAGGAKAKAQSQSVNASFGGVQAQIAADKAAMEKAAQANAQAAQDGEKNKEQLASATVNVDEKKIGIIIGPGGKRIKELTAKSGVNNIDTSGEVFTITGPPKAVEVCKKAIEDLNTKGYTALLFDDFADDTIMVPTTILPELIGKKGVNIIKLKDELSVEVNISDTGGKKSKVTIAGSKANAQKARECVESIMKYYHSEITHPGVTHEEMDIETYQYAFIIGKAGSEMRHIQKNYNVRVYIPRDGESAHDKVIVVGEPKDVTRAKTYIEKVIWNAENQTRGRDKSDKADDHWGDEGEEEPWMKQYLYKRTYK